MGRESVSIGREWVLFTVNLVYGAKKCVCI